MESICVCVIILNTHTQKKLFKWSFSLGNIYFFIILYYFSHQFWINMFKLTFLESDSTGSSMHIIKHISSNFLQVFSAGTPHPHLHLGDNSTNWMWEGRLHSADQPFQVVSSGSARGDSTKLFLVRQESFNQGSDYNYQVQVGGAGVKECLYFHNLNIICSILITVSVTHICTSQIRMRF